MKKKIKYYLYLIFFYYIFHESKVPKFEIFLTLQVHISKNINYIITIGPNMLHSTFFICILIKNNKKIVWVKINKSLQLFKQFRLKNMAQGCPTPTYIYIVSRAI